MTYSAWFTFVQTDVVINSEGKRTKKQNEVQQHQPPTRRSYWLQSSYMFLFIYFLFNALEKGQAEKRRSFNPGYVFDLLHICLFQSLQVRRVGFDGQFTAVSFHRFFPFDNSFLGFFLKHSKAECWGNNHAQGEAPIGRTSFSGRNKH